MAQRTKVIINYKTLPVWLPPRGSWCYRRRAYTPLPVIGVPIRGMLDGLDAMLSIIQMPVCLAFRWLPRTTIGVNAAQNAAILAAEMIALADEEVAQKVEAWKAGLGAKIEKANQDLAEVKYDFKCN